MARPQKIPSLPRGTHPEARAWYRSLAKSGPSQLYQPSDWEYARICALLLSDALLAEPRDAEVLSAVSEAMRSTLDTRCRR